MLISAKNIAKTYRTGDVVTPVLHDVDIEIKKGEFVAIVGPSGSGKSTLMHILGFLERPSKGSFTFEDKQVTHLSDDELAHIRNARIGFVFQAFYLLPRTTVLENVVLPLLYSKTRDRHAQEKRAREALRAVGLEHRLGYLSNQISGGQKQRVAIARALVNDPALIFADEPTGNLDSRSGKNVMGIFAKLHQEGRTIVLVTHDKEVARHAERIITIRDGNIVSDERVSDRIIPTIEESSE